MSLIPLWRLRITYSRGPKHTTRQNADFWWHTESGNRLYKKGFLRYIEILMYRMVKNLGEATLVDTNLEYEECILLGRFKIIDDVNLDSQPRCEPR
jgi:hypothetical protein